MHCFGGHAACDLGLDKSLCLIHVPVLKQVPGEHEAAKIIPKISSLEGPSGSNQQCLVNTNGEAPGPDMTALCTSTLTRTDVLTVPVQPVDLGTKSLSPNPTAIVLVKAPTVGLESASPKIVSPKAVSPKIVDPAPIGLGPSRASKLSYDSSIGLDLDESPMQANKEFNVPKRLLQRGRKTSTPVGPSEPKISLEWKVCQISSLDFNEYQR